MKQNQATGENKNIRVFNFAEESNAAQLRNRGDLSAIVAIAQENAIGTRGGLLCYLPADLKHFKSLTMGHSIIMGRKTFDSLPKGALPGRENIVITTNPEFSAEGVVVCHSIEEAIERASMPGEKFIIGGASIYTAAMPWVSTLHLTEIDASFAEADTFFPVIDPLEWFETWREEHEADERNAHNYTFRTLKRK